MDFRINVIFKIRYNDWSRYKGKRRGAVVHTDLTIKAIHAAAQAIADELGVEVSLVGIEVPRKESE